MRNNHITFWDFMKTIFTWFFSDEQQIERRRHTAEHPEQRFCDPE
jgi:hypothetical protein